MATLMDILDKMRSNSAGVRFAELAIIISGKPGRRAEATGYIKPLGSATRV
jgi:hypothetical protein